MKRLWLFVVLLPALVLPVRAQTIRWVDFDVPYESMKYALDQDILTAQQEKHISWIDALALAACRTGGKCGLSAVKKAVSDLKKDKSPEELLNCTPFVRQYDILSNKWGVLLCQKEYQTNDIRQSSREWL